MGLKQKEYLSNSILQDTIWEFPAISLSWVQKSISQQNYIIKKKKQFKNTKNKKNKKTKTKTKTTTRIRPEFENLQGYHWE